VKVSLSAGFLHDSGIHIACECIGYSWKHKLQILEYLEVASPCLATGSYQNLFVNQLGYIQ
jgi:hypothetical protein